MTKRSGTSTDNVLRDLGFPDADELSAKATLALRINRLLDARHLTQTAAAALLDLPQPKISAIRNYRLRGISLERLMRALVSLDQSVEIVVRPVKGRRRRGIEVAA